MSTSDRDGSWLLVGLRFRCFLGLGQQVCTLEGRAQGQIEEDDADGGGHAVHEGDAAGDLGQSLGDGVLLAEDEHVAEGSVKTFSSRPEAAATITLAR